MTTSTTPKNIEAVPYRWFNTTRSVKEGKKQGGKVAVMHSDAPGFADVLVYEPDHEDWWRVVPSDVTIRAAIRGPAQNGSDLIAWALPLVNQPTETQKRILERLPELTIMTDEQTETPDPVAAQPESKAMVDNAVDKTVRLAKVKRMQRLVLKGEWLDRYEQQMKVIQSVFCDALSDWYDDESEEADERFTHQIIDAVHLYMEVARSLRVNCFCPKSEYDGILYMHDGLEENKTVTEVVNVKEAFKCSG